MFSLWRAQIIVYVMAWWSYRVICTSHYRIIIIMQSCLKVLNCQNACQIYSVSSVCLRFGQFSVLYFMQYIGFCVFSLPISLMIIVRIPVHDIIIIIISEVWPIVHCLVLGHEAMVCTVCLPIFLQMASEMELWYSMMLVWTDSLYKQPRCRWSDSPWRSCYVIPCHAL